MLGSLLFKLPDETLSEILSYFVNEKRLLCSLSLQSRHFSEAIRILLFRYVFLNPCPDGKKFELFLRSIAEHLELALVQDMRLDFEGAYRQVYEFIDRILGELQGLRTLGLMGYSSYEYEDDVFQNNFLATGSMNPLSTVNLAIAEFTTEGMAKYVSLPHLKSMFIHSETPSLSKILPLREYSNPTLRELKFRASVPLSSLNILLAVFPNLTSRTTYLPGQEEQSHKLVTTVSPGLLSQLLDQIKSALSDFALLDKTSSGQVMMAHGPI